MNWQPISTAPKETALLLATEFFGTGDWRIKCGSFYGGEWHVWGASWTPSHWMPLPAAPGEPAVDAQENWSPTAAAINALPAGLRAYIHDLVAQSDPAGMVAENTLLRDQTRQLDAMIGRLKAEQASTQAALTEVIGCFDAANIEGLDDALVNNTDARLADLVQRRLLHAGYAAIGAQQALAAQAAAEESP